MPARPWIQSIAALLLTGCTLPQRARVAPVDTGPVSAAELGRECSNLRADIGSARYRQRNLPPASSNPAIAGSAEARADQRIEALRARYQSLGCALLAPDATAPADRAPTAPSSE
jgi:hypothetical protein